MNNKFLYKTEKEYKRKHNTDYSCLTSLLISYVKFWKYSRDSRHKKSYLRKILNTYIELLYNCSFFFWIKVYTTN